MRLYDVLQPIAEYVNRAKRREVLTALTLGGNSQMIGRYTTRTSPVYGGGCVVSVYIKTGEKPDVITLSSYGSSTGTYYFRGEMFAVEL